MSNGADLFVPILLRCARTAVSQIWFTAHKQEWFARHVLKHFQHPLKVERFLFRLLNKRKEKGERLRQKAFHLLLTWYSWEFSYLLNHGENKLFQLITGISSKRRVFYIILFKVQFTLLYLFFIYSNYCTMRIYKDCSWWKTWFKTSLFKQYRKCKQLPSGWCYLETHH